ncbi:MAG: hypothetical protein HY815_25555 [Candidatus Riflebacteria bacterium]|nr:hypothetical protein [Candidatus Riflebacteria bacterium]
MRPPRTSDAHTLVELIVALGLTGTVLASMYMVTVAPGDQARDFVVSDPREVRGLQGRLQELVREVQESTRVFFPLAGKGNADGLGIVNGKGETILFFAEDDLATGKKRLIRVNATASVAAGYDRATVFVSRLSHFRASVAPAEPGKEPSLVSLDLAIELAGSDPSRPRTLAFVTSAFPRNLERGAPDDIFPQGTPLYD